MTRAFLFILVGLAVMSTGCSDPYGNPEGEYENLKVDLEAQRSAIEAILDEALGSYQILGIDVYVAHCEPLSAWSGGTSFMVMPSDGDRHAAIEAIVSVLERRGNRVDNLDIVGEQTLPVRSAEVPGFVTPLTFYSGTDPQPGVKIKGGGGCYESGRIGADELSDLSYSEGSVTLVRE